MANVSDLQFNLKICSLHAILKQAWRKHKILNTAKAFFWNKNYNVIKCFPLGLKIKIQITYPIIERCIMIPMTLAILKLILFFKIKLVFLGDKHT